MTKIPVKMHSLKKIYEEFGMDWAATRELKELNISKARMYELRGELEKTIWHDGIENHDGSEVHAEYAMKIGNFWRISPKGLLALYNHFEIADDNLKEVALKLLLGEEV